MKFQSLQTIHEPMVRRVLIALVACFSAVVADACSSSSNVVGETGADGGPFFGRDAEVEASPEAGGFCPTNQCTPPFASCPNSRFPCDVDLRTDLDNCGACGVVCPQLAGELLGAILACVDGVCVMQCKRDVLAARADCDGIPDNGCEATLGSSSNCRACGDVCPAGEPCVEGSCGCPPPFTNCRGDCVDLTMDDFACGRCDVVCAPDDPGPPPPHSYYGCMKSECGHPKCDESPPEYKWANCNDDMSDGCETDLYALDDGNCGACGKTCTGGQHCALYSGLFGTRPLCACPDGLTECSEHLCVDLMTDPTSCGSCGRQCPNPGGESHAAVACVGGECKQVCTQGYADCNDDPDDGCEVNLGTDPRNCGSCGSTCVGVVGQACIGGGCAVKPCGGPN